jgi:molybdopterin/thiamine biosynthesis adenylyltransferase
MNRFNRQENIAGWGQEKLGQGAVIVVGRGWLGTFLVWALCSIGVGKIFWVGKPRGVTQRMAEWILADPCPFDGCLVQAIPADPVYESMLDWVVNGSPSSSCVLVDCSEDVGITAICGRFCDRLKGISRLIGGTSGGGWLGGNGRPVSRRMREPNPGEPVVAMGIAALLADGVRVSLCPLRSDLPVIDGCLGWEFSPFASSAPERGTAILVGVGGIGVYVATLLAAEGHGVLLVDFDQVEDSNRNRQGLFTTTDALERADKAVAARKALQRLFPKTRVLSLVQRVNSGFDAIIKRVRPCPTALLSAVDNAQTRLRLQHLGEQMRTNVVQGGTDVFAADCFTQVVGGRSLDDQMHGMLAESTARERQAANRNTGCAENPSYVVPGMVAGAMLVRRFKQLLLPHQGQSLPPIRWRQGAFPCETEDQFDEIDTDIQFLRGTTDPAS